MPRPSLYNSRLDRPVTLRELYVKAHPILWKGKWAKTVWTNLEEADEIMGRPKLADVTTAAIEDYKQVLSSIVAPATCNRKMNALHKLLKWAYQREYISKMPVFPWNKEDNTRVRWLKPEEEKQLLSLLPPETAAFCEILMHTGMRRGELLNLKPEHIDGDYARIWKTKTGKPRSVPLNDRAKELCKQWLPFKLAPNTIHNHWLKAKTAMGLDHDKDFVLHMLRHTAATRMLDATGNIAVVSKLLGHAKITTTSRYAHIADEQLLEAVRITAQKRQSDAVTT